jgi:hypothetical protein
MITKEQLKAEIEYVPDAYVEMLYQIIKVFEYPASPEPSKNDTKAEWRTFIEETYGCLADDPIARGPQGDYETREALE